MRLPLQYFVCRFTAMFLCCFAFAETSAQAEKPLEYNKDIRPILSDHCFACHGPAEGSREADLRLDERESALDLGSIVPGEPDESEMIRRILSADHDEIMPPAESNKPLSAEQKEILSRWIKQGAKYQVHWSFIAPVKPKLPLVSDPTWVKNPIDQFVLAQLDLQGLKPSQQADRATLIRRVCFDLTGLPPTLKDLKRFNASQEANWYEQMVDLYLAQPAFGERMALSWMDAARYGDTSVFHADGPRDMWPWRNWVIDSYNQSKPFDEFTVEQIAGDLIENATPYQKIASGFNRNHATTDEGGAIAEEWRIDYVVDRVQTTSNVWLGISMECAQCHSHKFDPISQKEYYGFFAFFNQTSDPGMQSRKGNQTPVVNVPDVQRDTQIEQLTQLIAKADLALKDNEKQIEPAFQKWIVEESEKVRSGNGPQPPSDMLAHFTLDETAGEQVSDSIANLKGTVKGKASWIAAKHAGGIQLDGSNFIELGDIGNFDNNEAISYGCWVKPQGNPSGAPIAKMNEDNSHRGWDMLISNGNVAVYIINSWPGNAIKVTTKEKIPADKWTHLFATYDGSGKAEGVGSWPTRASRLDGGSSTRLPGRGGFRRRSTSGSRRSSWS
ncbi:MAG: DUF1549 domain-containing protein [Planctomycetaceae bacterium]|nr:DUF1549 domain-containing protein [Planctomycetaceae bacterium]